MEPVKETEEQVNTELEERLLEDPNDWKTWKAYSAWLTQRGEPRGELIPATNTFSERERAERIIAAQWTKWFGALSRTAVECEWHDGFVRELRLKRDVPAELTGRALFARRSLKFLRTLKLDAEVMGSLFGIEGLRLLRRIELVPSVHLLNELALHRPAATRELRLSPPLTGDAMEALGTIPWLAQLTGFELGKLGMSDVQVLLAHPRVLQQVAGVLLLPVSEPAVVAHRSELRAAFPRAILQTQVNPRDYGYQRLSPTARSTPHHAPANFRELPPAVGREEQAILSRDMERYTVGSGVRVEKGSRIYSRCAACASEDTLCIYSKYSSSYSERHCETYHWSMREFVCNECGQFTYYEAYWES